MTLVDINSCINNIDDHEAVYTSGQSPTYGIWRDFGNVSINDENYATESQVEMHAENIHMKILVPSVAAGAIIGKGGETIAQVQKDAGARVKMSKANDFYPGTSERVCLIMGSVDAVRKVHDFIMDKIREKPDPNAKFDAESKSNYERHKQVKILVPNSTAGMIIGKAGNYIKQVKEESGAYVQISQKAKDANLPERCVIIAGDIDNTRKAVDLILQKIVEDPQSGSCPNISYADYTGPVASANPTGSPFANSAQYSQNRSMDTSPNNNFGGNTQIPGAGGFNAGYGNNSQQQFGTVSVPNMNMSANGININAMDNLRATLRGSGYTDHATDEISTAMTTLAQYGLIGGMPHMGINNVGNLSNLGLNSPAAGMTGMNMGPGPGSNMGATSMMATPTTPTANTASSGFLPPQTPTAGTTGSIFGPVGSGASGLGSAGSSGAQSSLFSNTSPGLANERYGSSPMLNESFGSNYASPPSTGFQTNPLAGDRSPSMNQNSFGLGTGLSSYNAQQQSSEEPNQSKQELEVPENIVGAILGPGGKSIVELQQLTGTNIQISKKGVYVPGTRNRIVTMTGTMTSINQANYLIQQRIQQEEIKRARQGQGQGSAR